MPTSKRGRERWFLPQSLHLLCVARRRVRASTCLAHYVLLRLGMPRHSHLVDKGRRRGFDLLDDKDILALVLSTGNSEPQCRQIAAVLLDEFGGLCGLWRVAQDGGTGLLSLGEARAARLAAAFELGLRCVEGQHRAYECVRGPADVVRLLGPRLGHLLHEQMWLLALDSGSRLVAQRRVAEGGRHGCAIRACDVLRPVLSLGASSFILAHNHPGGEAAPSEQDLHLTESVSRASASVGVDFLDHVIIAGRRHVSLLEQGLVFADSGREDRLTPRKPPDLDPLVSPRTGPDPPLRTAPSRRDPLPAKPPRLR